MLQIDNKIQQFSYKLTQLRSDLWKYPKKLKIIQKELSVINKEEKSQDWIDKLPFPIASILRHYYATKDNRKKIEHLFHFYEAFSEFLCLLLLSAYAQDKNFYDNECHNWVKTEDKYKNWHLTPSFGGWNTLLSKLASATRSLVDPQNQDKNDICRSLLGYPSDDYLKMVTSRKIVTLLEEIAKYRNKWKGHGGISSKADDEQRVVVLGGKLEELKKIIGDGFENVKLLSPATNFYNNGVFYYNVRELIGTRTPFNEIEVPSILPMDIERLYLLHSNQSKPILLLPFIRFMEGPIFKQEACYFYTGLENKEIRWISYHFDKEGSIPKSDNELEQSLELLKAR